MAEVFQASLRGVEGFRREVAVKRMRRSLSSDPDFGKMFVNEAQVASRLSHPNIAAVLDFDRGDDGRYYLVMELVPGVDLRKVASSGPVSVAIAVYVVGEILRGLDSAHRLVVDGKPASVIHRDISPHNVMVSWDGAIKIVDFGIAKALAATAVSRSGSLKGKASYMSPEQAHGQELDGRADLFATGVLFHELLTGKRLFRGETEAETLSLMLTAPIPRPRELGAELPEDVEAIAMQLVERDRDARPDSARAALESLLDCSGYSPRARLDLERLLDERFPAELRGGRALTVDPMAETVASDAIATPSSVHGTKLGIGSGVVPPVAASATPLPGGVTTAAESPQARRVPLAGATLTAAEAPAPVSVPVANRTMTAAESTQPAAAGTARRSRAPLWIAAAAVATGAAAAGSMAVLGGDPAPRVAGADTSRLDAAGPGEVSPQPAPAAGAAGARGSEAAAPGSDEAAVTAADDEAAVANSEAAAANSAAALPGTAGAEPTSSAAPRSSESTAPRRDEPAEPTRDRRPPTRERSEPDETRAAAPATIEVVVQAGQWGLVSVDGKSYGQTPARVVLAPGRYEVVVENPELGTRGRRSIRVRAGARRTVQVELR